MDNKFVATPTMWKFMEDPTYIRVLAGPVGSGKSVCCIHELVKLATQQAPNQDGKRLFRAAIVRNTFDQLRSTTLKTWLSWFPDGVWGTWKVTEKTFYMHHRLPDGTQMEAEFFFLPLDEPDSVRKALSLELTALYMNEWRELHPQVVDGLLMRLRRYPSMKDGGPTRSCAIFDTNMPDMDTWHFNKMENPPANWAIHVQPPAILSKQEYIEKYDEDPLTDGIEDDKKQLWYLNPGADNLKNLDKDYYIDTVPGKTEDYINVYLRCKYGRSLSGLPVYDKTFTSDYHIAADNFTPIQSVEYPVVIGLDFGRTPAAVLGQRNIRGQVVVLDELTSSNMGIETFISTKLKPLLTARYAGCTFIVAPDPAGWQKQQIGEISMVDVLRKEGFKVARPSTNDPEKRIQSVERLLTQNIGGKPLLTIAPRCVALIKGFRYGYRYKVNKSGVQENKPDKNEHSHCHDALQYMCLIIEGNRTPGNYFAETRRREVQIAPYAWT